MAELITGNSSDWLLEQFYNANKADFETFRVYKCFARYIDDNRNFIGVTEEIIPNTLRFKPLNDVADDCLFSVTFFSKYIKSRQNRRGAPGVRFYTHTGKNAFAAIGYNSISSHWEFWVDYVNNTIRMHK